MMDFAHLRTRSFGFWLFPMLLAAVGWSYPATAHQVKLAAEVGGTLHIEPNDTPRAGEPNLTWFALTRQGGQIIPLEACNCELAVYPSASGDPAPPEMPDLFPVSEEGYTAIPAANITFPQVGAYELVLTGNPKTPGEFQPFELRFDVTVAVGQAIASPQPESATSSDRPTDAASSTSEVLSSNPSTADRSAPLPSTELILGAIALGGLLVGGGIWSVAQSTKRKDI